MSETARLAGDLLCLVLCISASIFDLRRRTIPNYLTITAGTMGLVLAFLSSSGLGVAGALLGALLLGGLLALFAAAGGMGWGDVKLNAAVGALLGWPLPFFSLVLYALFYTAISGGVIALIAAARQKKLGAALKATATLPRRQEKRKPSGVTIPYGVAISIGAAWAVIGRYFPVILIG